MTHLSNRISALENHGEPNGLDEKALSSALDTLGDFHLDCLIEFKRYQEKGYSVEDIEVKMNAAHWRGVLEASELLEAEYNRVLAGGKPRRCICGHQQHFRSD